MNISLSNTKLIIGIIYLIIISVGIYFLFSYVDIKDLTSYEFIRSNKDIILKYKSENFFLLTIIFFIFSIFWVMLLGFAMPLLLFAGFVFGKWWGILIIIISTTIGATLLYLLANLFFRNLIEEKLTKRFFKLKVFFNKNEVLYFMFFRFIGGGGLPYSIQNILPVLFNMSVKNYVIATFLGSLPSMFVTIAFGSGVESVLDKNDQFNIVRIISSPEIYLPIIGFFIILFAAFLMKKIFFKN